MALSEIGSIPKTPEEMMTWSFSHATFHRDTINAIFQRYARSLPEYILDPFDPNSMAYWLYQHQIMHNQQNQILNIQGSDLNSLDWKDSESVLNWFNSHSNEHYQAGAILNIG